MTYIVSRYQQRLKKVLFLNYKLLRCSVQYCTFHMWLRPIVYFLYGITTSVWVFSSQSFKIINLKGMLIFGNLFNIFIHTNQYSVIYFNYHVCRMNPSFCLSRILFRLYYLAIDKNVISKTCYKKKHFSFKLHIIPLK